MLFYIRAATERPLTLATDETDFFGNVILDTDFNDLALACPKSDDQFKTMILTCLAAVTSVLERQYQRYFQMELSGQLRRETQTARLHNFDAEQVFGMMNAAKKRAPNASYCFLSSKIRSVKNKVVDFLNSLDEEKRERIVNWAKGKARLRRSANQVRLGELRKEMINRQMKKRQQKQDKERRQVELQL